MAELEDKIKAFAKKAGSERQNYTRIRRQYD